MDCKLEVVSIPVSDKFLVEHGVNASPVRRLHNGEWIDRPGNRWNSFVRVSDPDGTGWVLQERPAGGRLGPWRTRTGW